MRLMTQNTTSDTGWEALTPALRECGEIAAMRLSQALADAVLNASNALLDQATQSLTPIEREAWLESADVARAMRLGIGREFTRHFQMRYARACQDGAQRTVPDEPLALRDISPQGHGVGFIERFRQYVAWDGLSRLTRCYADLLGNTDLDPLDSPVGPRVLDAALQAALHAQPGGEAAKARLRSAVHKEFLGRVNLLYRDLTSFMIALGFVETRALTQRRSEHAPPAVATETPAESDAQDVPAPAPEDACLASLAPGSWIEYRRPGKAPHPLRLSWASPKRSLFLWTTAEGGRTLCVSAEELSAAFAAGRARLINVGQTAAGTVVGQRKTA